MVNEDALRDNLSNYTASIVSSLRVNQIALKQLNTRFVTSFVQYVISINTMNGNRRLKKKSVLRKKLAKYFTKYLEY